MIQLTRLNSQPLVVNSDLIKFVERAPDTVLTLINGEKIVVREGSEEVLAKIVEFRRSIFCGLPIAIPGTLNLGEAALDSSGKGELHKPGHGQE